MLCYWNKEGLGRLNKWYVFYSAVENICFRSSDLVLCSLKYFISSGLYNYFCSTSDDGFAVFLHETKAFVYPLFLFFFSSVILFIIKEQSTCFWWYCNFLGRFCWLNNWTHWWPFSNHCTTMFLASVSDSSWLQCLSLAWKYLINYHLVN